MSMGFTEVIPVRPRRSRRTVKLRGVPSHCCDHPTCRSPAIGVFDGVIAVGLIEVVNAGGMRRFASDFRISLDGPAGGRGDSGR
ncbi:hypothetical protein FRACA_2300006 [Frankia canadensis]|uniref:Uncharacterized protein n=1 Tax=Frankia canadensis TaxID=1836972 RepID=A0A2I2KRH3_9ACTN|nr:hypothetical protein FRACA_2300006 [Frankia canadensis]SOU55542.1 hypothetical protein FRACA_2300006 [Frankia canadensis]